MARRLVEAGVGLVQVNLGNNETWDTHGNAFPHLKDNLLPPTDRAVSALLDDLHGCGLLDSTLVVMAGEFGRTPRISPLPRRTSCRAATTGAACRRCSWRAAAWSGAGWSARPTGSAGTRRSDPQTPENLAATIYRALGIPALVAWHDDLDRPHYVYRGIPILGLS